MRPVLSVIVLAYQHAPYIATALDSILGQEFDRPMEVIVHDDASTDGTADIIRDYASQYPEVIKPILQAKNQYSLERGRVTQIVYGATMGKYIAVCEGDDHWIDPLKLRKQVEALEADPAAVGCFTDAWNERDGKRTNYLDGHYATPPMQPVLNQLDMVLGQGVPVCTFMFRREHLFPLPAVFKRSPVGDTWLFVHLTRNGHLLYLPWHTGVRVMHAGGAHSLTGRLHRIKIKERVWPLLDEMTAGRYQAEIARMFNGMYGTAWERALKEDDQAVLRHIWPQLAKRRHLMGWSLARTALNWARAWAPAMANAVERRRE